MTLAEKCPVIEEKALTSGDRNTIKAIAESCRLFPHNITDLEIMIELRVGEGVDSWEIMIAKKVLRILDGSLML